jgi:hypothetical protein
MNQFIKLGFRYQHTDPDHREVLGLPLDDRRRHMLITGKSGTGKSTLIKQIFSQEANSGRGCFLIDPHGDLAEECLDLVPGHRIRKTIYINPDDDQFPIGFNLLEAVPPDRRAARASEIVTAFQAIWPDSWGPQLQHILTNCLLTLLEVPGTTLLGVRQLIRNKAYREKILAKVADPFIRDFWEQDFRDYLKKDAAFTSVLNKLGQLLDAPLVRNMLGQSKSAFSPRHLIDNNYIVIANLSKGRLGPDHARMLGMFLISAFTSAALSRADIQPSARKDFALLIDEFQSFTTTSLETLLEEARKYGVALTLANQHFGQLPERLCKSVLGNVASLVTFTVGNDDAKLLEQEHFDVTAEQLRGIPRHYAFARLSRYGAANASLILATSPGVKRHGHAKTIIKHSRHQYATPRADVERRLRQFRSASSVDW